MSLSEFGGLWKDEKTQRVLAGLGSTALAGKAARFSGNLTQSAYCRLIELIGHFWFSANDNPLDRTLANIWFSRPKPLLVFSK